MVIIIQMFIMICDEYHELKDKGVNEGQYWIISIRWWRVIIVEIIQIIEIIIIGNIILDYLIKLNNAKDGIASRQRELHQ